MSEDLTTITQTTTTQTVTVECGLCGRTVPVTMRITWTNIRGTTHAAPIPAPESTHTCHPCQRKDQT